MFNNQELCIAYLIIICFEFMTFMKKLNTCNLLKETFVTSMKKICLYSTLNVKNLKDSRYLIFCNPFGGRGKAPKIWEEIKPYFDASFIEYDLVMTKYHRHAYDYLKDLDFFKNTNGDNLTDPYYNGIICISGDGIIHETINAILSRHDREILLNKITWGHIPSGTGNGLIKSLSEISKTDCDHLDATLIALKGINNFKKIDLIECEFLSSKVYSFHSVSFGVVSDVGLESEVCRCIGPVRFTIWGLWRLCCLCVRKYYATFFFCKDDRIIQNIPSLKEKITDPNIEEETYRMQYFWTTNVPWVTREIHFRNNTYLDDGKADVNIGTGGACKLLKFLSNKNIQNHFDKLKNHDNENLKKHFGYSYNFTNFVRVIPRRNLNYDKNEPLTDKKQWNTKLSIDGEAYEIQPFQLTSLNKVMKVFCFNSKEDLLEDKINAENTMKNLKDYFENMGDVENADDGIKKIKMPSDISEKGRKRIFDNKDVEMTNLQTNKDRKNLENIKENVNNLEKLETRI